MLSAVDILLTRLFVVLSNSDTVLQLFKYFLQWTVLTSAFYNKPDDVYCVYGAYSVCVVFMVCMVC
jgi:hypothetical protein